MDLLTEGKGVEELTRATNRLPALASQINARQGAPSRNQCVWTLVGQPMPLESPVMTPAGS
jgi:hypothetical protein